MPIARRDILAAALGGAVGTASRAAAEAYPSRPIRLVVPWPAGGGSDFIARTISPRMAERIGQPIVVENRPGAASNLGAQFVARAQPDGYTILQGDVATFAVNQSLYRDLPFDPERDFAPISLVGRFVTVLLANPAKLEADSVAGLIAAARAAPEALDIAHVGVGSPFHLAAVRFERAAGIRLNTVSYRGAGPAVQGLLSGDAHLMFVDYATARPQIAAGRLRVLGLGSTEPRPELPGVPPVAATPGLEGFEVAPWQGLAAPANTPPAVIARLRDAYAAAAEDPGVRRRLAEFGTEILRSTPQEFAEYRRAEAARWAEVIRAADIRAE